MVSVFPFHVSLGFVFSVNVTWCFQVMSDISTTFCSVKFYKKRNGLKLYAETSRVGWKISK